MFNNNLFARLALTFLIILLIVATIVSYISFQTSQNYHEEANQRLHVKLAQFTADHVNAFTNEGQIDTSAVSTVMHSMMVINPDVEVYLLNNSGDIKWHVAPYKKVVRTKVNLDPIKRFIATEELDETIRGDDPRAQDQKKVFSAAEIKNENGVLGYFYIILASQERQGVLDALKRTFAFKVGLRLIIFTILGSLLLGLLAFWLQLRNLRPITRSMQDFQAGNFSVRAPSNSGNFSILSNTFNAMASQIEQHVEKIKSLDTFRKELVANVSHDLKTPLSIIMGYTETLQLKNESLSEQERNKFIENISESSKRLNGLVNQLFELSNLENDQVTINNEAFSLGDLVDNMITNYGDLAQKKNITLEFDGTQKNSMVFGDIALVERVIQNLLDNALKFTPEGGRIAVDISQDKEHVHCKISDTGVGIAENELNSVFDRYHKSGQKNKKGTGLGLAIANKIIELHNSKINVFSKSGEGTTFSFNLPLFTL